SRQSEPPVGMMLDLGEHSPRLIGLSLPAAELGQPDKCLACHARKVALKLGGGKPQLLLSLRPQSPEHEDAGVVGPADRKQGLRAVSLAELQQTVAPLSGPVEIAHTLAGEDQVAAGVRDRRQILEISSDDRRRRTV